MGAGVQCWVLSRFLRPGSVLDFAPGPALRTGARGDPKVQERPERSRAMRAGDERHGAAEPLPRHRGRAPWGVRSGRRAARLGRPGRRLSDWRARRPRPERRYRQARARWHHDARVAGVSGADCAEYGGAAERHRPRPHRSCAGPEWVDTSATRAGPGEVPSSRAQRWRVGDEPWCDAPAQPTSSRAVPARGTA
jgi:hypothetical protein